MNQHDKTTEGRIASTPNVTVRGILEGSRFNGVETFLRNTAHMMGLHLDMQVDKGWISVTCRFAITGPPLMVNYFQNHVRDTVAEYQRRCAQ